MENEEYEEAWQNHLLDFFRGLAYPFLCDGDDGIPYYFANPLCATCMHWHLIHRDGLDELPDPREYDLVEEGLQGRGTAWRW